MSSPFVLLPENRVAFNTAHVAVAGPSRMARGVGQPVTICGPTGAGKSALLNHIVADANKGASRRAKSALQFQTGVEFADEYRRADRDGATSDWQHKLSRVNILVLDGVDAVARQASVSQQLVAAIDDVTHRGGRVVLTTSNLPGQQRGFSPRLADRIRGGTALTIDPLGDESRAKLLRHFARRAHLTIEPDAFEKLVPALGTTAGEIASTVELLQSRTLRQGTDVTAAVVADLIRRTSGSTPSIPQIARAVAKEFSARVSDLRAAGRAQAVVIPRQTAMFLAREVAGEQYQKIGDYFGRRNHSTVVHSVRRVEQMLDDSPEFARRVVQIRTELGLPG